MYDAMDAVILCFCPISFVLLLLGTYLIYESSSDYAKFGDIHDWETATCRPSHNSQSECDGCISCDEGELLWHWMEVNADGHCESGIVLRQVDDNCQKKSSKSSWPNGTYDQSFLESGETINCWTNCDRYVDHSPRHRVNKARMLLVIGYACFLLTSLYVLFLLISLHEDYIPWSVLIRKNRNFYLLCLYVPFWFSCVNCGIASFVAGSCIEVSVGYGFLIFPMMICWVGCFSPDIIARGYDRIGYLIGSSLSMIGIIVFIITIFTREDVSSCFVLSWCEIQMSMCVGLHFIYFLLPISQDGPEGEKKKEFEAENEERLQILYKLEHKWRSQKDIILPLIDHREHIWNEIWALCWSMEESFFDDESNQRYCDLFLASMSTIQLLASIDSTDFTALGRRKCCCGVRSTITLRIVAESIGDVEWKVRENSSIALQYSSAFLDILQAPKRKLFAGLVREIDWGKLDEKKIELQPTHGNMV